MQEFVVIINLIGIGNILFNIFLGNDSFDVGMKKLSFLIFFILVK